MRNTKIAQKENSDKDSTIKEEDIEKQDLK